MKDEIRVILSMITIMVLVGLAAQVLTTNSVMVGKTIGHWEGQVMTSAFPYNDEYAINVMVDGDVVILTNQFEAMFDVPKTHVKFWGTIENFKPLVIHVDGIGW